MFDLAVPEMAPFFISGFILLILLLIELLSLLLGGFTGFLDSLIPDSLLDASTDMSGDAGIDADGDMGFAAKALDWLYVGKIPLMILIILFLGCFCISGILIQKIAVAGLGGFLSPWIASIDAIVVSVPMLKGVSALLYPIMPKDETTAISSNSFIGMKGTIPLGTARIDNPAQAKIIDQHNQAHYIMVEPDTRNIENKANGFLDTDDLNQEVESIEAGESVVITAKKGGNIYLAKRVNNQ